MASNTPLLPSNNAPGRSTAPRTPRWDSGRVVALVLSILGLGLVALSLLTVDPANPLGAAFLLVLGLLALTAAGIFGLLGHVRRAGRQLTVRPTTRGGWAGAVLLFAGWLMVIVPGLPGLDPTSTTSSVTQVLTVVLVTGYAVLMMGALLVIGAAWWGAEGSGPLILLAVLHAIWVSFAAYFFLGEIVANRR